MKYASCKSDKSVFPERTTTKYEISAVFQRSRWKQIRTRRITGRQRKKRLVRTRIIVRIVQIADHFKVGYLLPVFHVVIDDNFILEKENRIYKGIEQVLLKFRVEEIADAKIFYPFDYVFLFELRSRGKFGARELGFGGFLLCGLGFNPLKQSFTRRGRRGWEHIQIGYDFGFQRVNFLSDSKDIFRFLVVAQATNHAAGNIVEAFRIQDVFGRLFSDVPL